MIVLSIQSHVACDPVGNSAAVFPLQRLGIEVWPVHTVQLSGHAGRAGRGGGALAPAHVAEVLAGIERGGGFARVDAILTGYMGAPELVAVVAEAVDRAKAANPKLLFCCDPVLGNAGKGLFLAEAVATAIRDRLLPLADLATPNAFELSWLAGAPAATPQEALAAAARIAPRRLAVTSLATQAGTGALLRDQDGAWLVETPRLAVPGDGAGDLFSALLLAHLLAGAPSPDALALAVSSVYALLAAGGDAGPALVAAQSEIVSPSRLFGVHELRGFPPLTN